MNRPQITVLITNLIRGIITEFGLKELKNCVSQSVFLKLRKCQHHGGIKVVWPKKESFYKHLYDEKEELLYLNLPDFHF
jgi:hypothetical protein